MKTLGAAGHAFMSMFNPQAAAARRADKNRRTTRPAAAAGLPLQVPPSAAAARFPVPSAAKPAAAGIPLFSPPPPPTFSQPDHPSPVGLTKLTTEPGLGQEGGGGRVGDKAAWGTPHKPTQDDWTPMEKPKALKP